MVFSEEHKALIKNVYLIKGYRSLRLITVSWKKMEKIRIVETIGNVA